MKTVETMMSLLLLSAVCIAPASANWFSNPRTNTNLNIGSAPNPTPADLRAIGDSPYAAGPARGPAIPSSGGTYGASPRGVLSYNQTYVVAPSIHPMTAAQLNNLEYRPVFGARGEHLGYVIAVDHTSRLIELQTNRGVAVAMPASLVVDKNGKVMAPTTSRADILAMSKTQTGRTVALNVTPRNRIFRG